MYRILAAFEESGQARRGYVVEGLGAAQFAMEGAVDRLRAVSNARERGEGPPGRPDFTGGGFDAHVSPDGSDSPGDPVVGGSPFDDFPPGGHGHAGATGHSGDVFAAPPQPPASRGDYVSARDYAEPGAGGPRGGGAHGGFGGPRGAYGTGFAGRHGRPSAGPRAIVLAAADPANAYGAALGWPEPPAGATHKPGRKAGSLVVLVEGEPALYMERGGKTLLLWPAAPDGLPTDDPGLRAAAEALASAARAGSLGTVTVERVNGAAALTSPFGPLLEEAGFIATPRGLRIRA